MPDASYRSMPPGTKATAILLLLRSTQTPRGNRPFRKAQEPVGQGWRIENAHFHCICWIAFAVSLRPGPGPRPKIVVLSGRFVYIGTSGELAAARSIGLRQNRGSSDWGCMSSIYTTLGGGRSTAVAFLYQSSPAVDRDGNVTKRHGGIGMHNPQRQLTLYKGLEKFIF